MSGRLRMWLVAAVTVGSVLAAARAPASPNAGLGHQLAGPDAVPQEDAIRWEALEAHATLDRDGVLRVSEQLTLAVEGSPVVASRMFRTWIPSRVTVLSMARADPAGPGPHPLVPGSPDATDRYAVEYGILRWNLRGSADPPFSAGTAVTYYLEYAVSGAVIPIWGVRSFGTSSVIDPFFLHPLRRAAELWETWRLAPGGWSKRYLLDFDFSPFPFLGGNPIGRFSLDLRVDPVWRLLRAPGPARAPVAAVEDLRELLPIEFTGAGAPAGAGRVRQALWIAPLVALPVFVVAFVGARIGGVWSRKRRYDRTVVDGEWIRAHLLGLSPTDVRRLVAEDEGTQGSPAVPRFPAEPRSPGRLAIKALPAAVIGAGIVLILSALEAGGFQALVVGLFFGSAIYQLAKIPLRRSASSPDLPLLPLGALLVAALLFSVAAVGFFLTVPAEPRVIAGLAGFWAGLIWLLARAARPQWSESEIELRYGLSRARHYITAELEKPRPALADNWLPWMLALGLGDEVENWRRGRGMFAARAPKSESQGGDRWTGGTDTPAQAPGRPAQEGGRAADEPQSPPTRGAP